MIKKLESLKQRVSVICILILLVMNSVQVKAEGTPSLTSECAILLDVATGQILYEKNMHLVRNPASITKIMTGLLLLESGRIDESITMSYDAVFSVPRGAAHIALDVGEEIRGEDALNALAIDSANDAANGVAEFLGGSLVGFSQMMNDRAASLGALNTHFVNANGLDHKEHYTTAYDMALILAQATRTPKFNEYFSKSRGSMSPTNLQTETRYFNNNNGLLNGKNPYEYVIASKTGWTPSANHTLASVAEKDGRTLVVVVLNSPDATSKYIDTIQLFDYGFDAFEQKEITTTLEVDTMPFDVTMLRDYDVIMDKQISFFSLIHKDITPSSIIRTYTIDGRDIDGHIPITIQYQLEDSSLMYAFLGEQKYLVSTRAKGQGIQEQVLGSLSSSEGEEESLLSRVINGVIFVAFIGLLGIGGIRFYCQEKHRKNCLYIKREKAKQAAMAMRRDEI